MLKRFPVSEPVAAMLSALEEDGAVIVEGFLDPETLVRFNAELDDHVAQVTPGRAAHDKFCPTNNALHFANREVQRPRTSPRGAAEAAGAEHFPTQSPPRGSTRAQRDRGDVGIADRPLP